MSSYATAPDGTRISYRIDGNGDGPAVVLIHSLAMTKAFWDPVVAILSSDCKVVSMDCRGHGASDKPAGPYTVELFADDVAQVCKEAGVARAVVAGASMGGCVALALASRHPDLVAGLGLFDTTACYGDDAETAWSERAEKALENGMGSLVDFQKTRWFSDSFREADPDTVKACVDVFVANDLAAYAETCRMLGRCDLRDQLSDISVPTGILVGEEDYATPVAMAQAMQDAIPGAHMQVLPGARHLTPLEVPDTIAVTLARLVAHAS